MKRIINIFKKIIVTILILYSFNLIMAPLNLIIPINYITVLTIYLLGNFSIIGFVTIMLIIY